MRDIGATPGRCNIAEDIPLHQFDEARAQQYSASSTFTKTAILVPVADPEAKVTIDAPFGLEVMKGEFYVVASPEGPYGAAKVEFEAAHVEVEPNRWQKRGTVLAYKTTARCRVETWLADGTHETTVDAEPGDWIVRQPAGEVIVVEPKSFATRYEPVD